jgi:hypothetical protein
VGKSEGKTSVRRLRYKWEDGSKMDLRETGWECVAWIYLVEGRDLWQPFVNTMINLQVLAPWG